MGDKGGVRALVGALYLPAQLERLQANSKSCNPGARGATSAGQPSETLRVMDVGEHVDRWLAAWNAHDLDAIMDCYSVDVEFVAPTVVTRWKRSDGRLHGVAELREHFRRGLELAPELRFSKESLLTSPGSYALLYRRENNNLVLDVVELDDVGQANRVRAFYAQPQA
jgi:SnoaL-like domain